MHAPGVRVVHDRRRPVLYERNAERAPRLRAAQHHHGARLPPQPDGFQVRAVGAVRGQADEVQGSEGSGEGSELGSGGE